MTKLGFRECRDGERSCILEVDEFLTSMGFWFGSGFKEYRNDEEAKRRGEVQLAELCD